MTKQEMKDRINELRAAAETLTGSDRSDAITEIATLKIQMRGMALGELRAKLDAISLPNLEELDQKIQQAKNAGHAQQMRVAAINQGLRIVRSLLGIVV